jgi:choline dehydrogenase-like flavoprotein
VIFDAARLPLPGHLDADLCVVGSGPGGATVAALAAEAGLKVVVLEAGSLVTPGRMNQREEDMFPRLLWHAGGRTTADRAIRLLQGRGVGGSSLHNLNLCKRIPPSLRARWSRERGLEHLTPAVWDALYTEAEELLSVGPVAQARASASNRLLREGCEALGWRGGPLRHNRTGCVASGFCELGCSYDAKNNALKVFVPRVVEAGGQILSHAQAVRLRHSQGRVSGVEAVVLDPETLRPLDSLTVKAPLVCLSASATGTPALLLRSEVPDPGGETGRRLRIHPALIAAGEFKQPVHAWRGIPQSYECSQWLDFEASDPDAHHRSWIVSAFGHPVGVATMIPGHGAEHREVMKRFSHLSALTAMLHDETAGTVTPRGDLDLSVDYWPTSRDRRELLRGLKACARLHFAAGAVRVLIPGAPPRLLERVEQLDSLDDLQLERGSMGLSAVHPMGSVPMGDDPQVAAVDSAGKHHHLAGLWISDGSLFPSSIGVPPQLSIYALGLHVGRALVAAAG